MNIKLLGIDVETTGFEANEGHMITEIALDIVTLCTESLKVVDRKAWSTLVDPRRSIPEKVIEITGITPELVKGKPIWEDIAAKVHKVISGCDVFVAHNAMFDATFMHHMFEKVGLDTPDISVFCTMQNSRWSTPNGKVPKLVELCQAVGVPFDSDAAHRANYDTRMMMDALLIGLERGYYTVEKLKGETV